MEIDQLITGVEIEFHYAHGVNRNGPIKTLRVSVDGELTSELSKALLDKVNSYFVGSERLFDHIVIVGVARDWPSEKAERVRTTQEFLCRLFPSLASSSGAA